VFGVVFNAGAWRGSFHFSDVDIDSDFNDVVVADNVGRHVNIHFSELQVTHDCLWEQLLGIC
jgi:hypothetical protein